MYSLRARSEPAQLIAGTRYRSATGVATSALSPIAGPTTTSTSCSTSSANARSTAAAVPEGRPSPNGVDELDVTVEPARARELVDGEAQPALAVGRRRRTLAHVVQDADAHRYCHRGCSPRRARLRTAFGSTRSTGSRRPQSTTACNERDRRRFIGTCTPVTEKIAPIDLSAPHASTTSAHGVRD